MDFQTNSEKTFRNHCNLLFLPLRYGVIAKPGIAPVSRHETMKTKSLFPCLGEALMRSRVLPALVAALNLLPVGQVFGQTFTTLHSFSGGDSPFAGLVLSSNT